MKHPVRVLGVLLATVVLLGLGSGAAWADSPASPAWPDPPHRSALDTLILFGGGTLALIVFLTLFALLTARNNYVPPPPSTEIEPAPHH